MNTQSNTYTIIYSSIMVLVVGAALAFVYQALKPMQDENVANDKRQQILSAIHVVAPEDRVGETYEKYITGEFLTDTDGGRTEGDAFGVNMAAEVKKADGERMLPVFVATTDDGKTVYVLPVYGAGLWGPIWGYVAVEDDGDTVYGAYFSHSGETPGLGAEISTEHFQQQFAGKELYKDGKFRSIDVMKAGQKPTDDADYVDAISGGTITSKGVQSMLSDCLRLYDAFLNNLQTEKN